MKLGDKEYTPRYPIMSCISLESVVNKSVFVLIDEIRHSPPSIGTLSQIVWAGVIADEPKITLAEIINLLQEGGPGRFREAYKECLKVLDASMAHMLFDEEKGGETSTKN